MKRHCYIGIIFVGLALTMACNPKGSSLEPVGVPSHALSAIDSLMWRQPDTAFAQLLQLAETTDTDSLDAFDQHYFQLLVSELLYKNDYAQSNRVELRQAVGYFDSLAGLHPPFKGVRGIQKTVPFLDARTHYINGVGYYENDSVVEACSEYLKALEVMEDHFEEKELVGKRAQFMAYTYNRLMELFSSQFMIDPAITCGERALMFCKIEPTSSNGIPNILYFLGKQYDKKDDFNSAIRYYCQAMENLTDTSNLVYRDITSSMAFSCYHYGNGKEQSLRTLRKIIEQADDDNERMTRFLTIGSIFYMEGLYDSALLYLEPIFDSKQNEGQCVAAAEELRQIYSCLGKEIKLDSCTHFLAEHKKTDGENKVFVSKLETLFNNFMYNQLERQVEKERRVIVRNTLSLFVPLSLALVLTVITHLKRRSKNMLKKQQMETDQKIAENERENILKIEEMKKRFKKELENQYDEINVEYQAFLNEPVCQKIINSVVRLPLTTRTNYSDFPQAFLDEKTYLEFGNAISVHFPGLKTRIINQSAKLDWKDMQTCFLYLLGLNEVQIALLQQCHSSTAYRRRDKLKKSFGIDGSLAEFLMRQALLSMKK